MGKTLSHDPIDYLNIGLMLLSASLAFTFPFELFLCVYAFLGPLHYLTEISWLQDRQFFTRRRCDPIVLLMIALIMALSHLGVVSLGPGLMTTAMVFAFFSACFFATTTRPRDRLAYLGLLVLPIALLIGHSVTAISIFRIFLPSIIHVFLFTGLFMVSGVLKNRSVSGCLSLIVFVLCAAGLIWIHPDLVGAHPIPSDVRDSYEPFSLLNYSLSMFLQNGFSSLSLDPEGYVDYVNNQLYQDPEALALMSFIAFAYTYHYLNWFSKTSTLKWHRISRSRAVLIILLWIGSILLYLYHDDYGLDWLFFLSSIHVLLEFPLNHLTLLGLIKQISHVGRGTHHHQHWQQP